MLKMPKILMRMQTVRFDDTESKKMDYATGTPWRDLRLGTQTTKKIEKGFAVMDSGVGTPNGAVLFSLMEKSNATLLIPIGRDAPWPDLATGEKLSLKEFWLGGVLHIAMTCLSAKLEDVFWQLTISLLERLKNGTQASESIETTIEEFRSLLQLPEQDKVNYKELLGLIGELVLLRNRSEERRVGKEC